MSMGDDYIADTLKWERENPHVSPGMIVKIWDHSNPKKSKYCGLGKILTVKWSDQHHKHIVEVETRRLDKIVIALLLAGQCEPYTSSRLIKELNSSTVRRLPL